jgi:hypothetical protein
MKRTPKNKSDNSTRYTLSRFGLASDSPCIGAGTVVNDNGGRDFFGNPVPANDPPTIVAFQGAQN